ncbi:MAG: putative toxin-antitoxin system toxin component, PIN family [Candidatus Dormibacteraeota bacterium]|uniref:Toxin-antitoxin system toxin component, PIN family n=1 Tax=Candidatus Amunia macphersoniae TaxID=3127014 RepID=A0A934NFX9_9BACT|nr:putative toxin-antitoxin system toxin component, PIN family [Candidatus Dormibacteraeota bacterium]
MLDTNVLVSALHFGGRPRRVFESVLRGRHRLVIGPAILSEFEAVLVKTCAWDAARAGAVRGELEALADSVVPVEVPDVCRDPDDNEVLAIAAVGRAEVIVTGDVDLLALGAFEGVSVMTVAEFDDMPPDE